MALQVWLPMLGNTNNQGVYNSTITPSSTVTSDNSGKIGKCMNFSGTTSYINVTIPQPKNITVAFWLKRNANTGTRQFLFTAWNGVSIELATNGQLLGKVYSTTSSQGGQVNGHNITTDTGWIHIAYTFEDKVGGKLYENGALIGSKADSGSISWTVSAGDIGNYSGTYLNAKMNDFRFYDHALSAKEIEVLARGLVLHYPMTGGGRGCANLVKGSNTGSTSTNTFIFSEAVGGSTRSIEYDGGIPCAKITRNSTAHSSWAYLHYDNWDRAAIKPSTTYTLSFDIIGSGSGSIGFSGFMNGNATNNISASVEGIQNTFNSNGWSHLVFRTTTIADFTDKGTNQTIYMSCGYLNNTDVWIMMKNMKLEEGVHDTPWIPHTSDTGYSTMGYNDTIEYDVSGYNYHGTKTNVTYDSDTPRYTTSTKVTTTSGVFSRPSITFDKFTIAFWGKHTASNKILMGSCPDISTNNTTWYWYGDNSFKYPSGEFYYEHNAGTYTLNTWMHFVVTYDGSNIKVYRNGVYEGSKSATGNMTLDYLSVGRGIGSNYAEAGNVSDFRLYATALSATQVAELYNTAVSLSNNGTLLGYEFVET